MKSFISIVFVLMSLFLVGASKYVDDGNVRFNIAKETVGAITLYVRTDGVDTNTCTVDSAGGACLTIQAALNKIPKMVKHTVTVNIGAGNFAGFNLSGFTVPRYVGTLTIQGTLGDPTLTTGTTTGNATGGSTSQCVDSGQAWTTNELRGRLVLSGGQYRVVRTNTANTIDLVGTLTATCSGTAYHIYEQKTVINSGSPGYSSANLYISANRNGRDNFIIQKLSITGGTFGFFVHYTDGFTIQYVSATSNTYGIAVQSCPGEFILNDNYAGGNSGYGFSLLGIVGQLRPSRSYAYNNTSIGFYIAAITNDPQGLSLYADNNGVGFHLWSNTSLIETDLRAENNTGAGVNVLGPGKLTLVSGTLSSNGGYGLTAEAQPSGIKSGYSVVIVTAATIATNTSGGIYAGFGAELILSTVTGSSTGYGLTVDSGALAIVTSATAITGTLGNATIDTGASVLTWATDFATNGDGAVNDVTGARILRKD